MLSLAELHLKCEEREASDGERPRVSSEGPGGKVFFAGSGRFVAIRSSQCGAAFVAGGGCQSRGWSQAGRCRESVKENGGNPVEESDHSEIQQLLTEIESLRERVAELESRKTGNASAESAKAGATPEPLNAVTEALSAAPPTMAPASGAPAAANNTAVANAGPEPDPNGQDASGHNMSLPGGPMLNIRGFLDFNFDAGSVANPLIYPLTIPPPATVHDAFQFGEFDLFLSSRVSNTISFLSEIVFGGDASNSWGIDIERAQISYKPSPYFQISGGRMHTAIGYYNTAYHHGTWFQETATGRPYMYFYEDSGGILPVHLVGMEASGLIPGTGKINAHWIAEVGERSELKASSPADREPAGAEFRVRHGSQSVQPRGIHQDGGAANRRKLLQHDPCSGVPHVNNTITGAYVVYLTSVWEFFNELQIQRDHSFGSGVSYNTPLGYTQLSRKFGKYRPYVRWQEVNVPVNDPLYGSVGRFDGPSLGLRMDFADYAALKVQFNRIYTRSPLAMNSLRQPGFVHILGATMKRPYFCSRYLYAVGLLVVLFASNAPTVAEDEVAIIVNPSNSVASLSAGDLHRIFLGDKSTWPNGKHIFLVMAAPGSAERAVVLKNVYKMSEADYAKFFLQATFTGAVSAPPKDAYWRRRSNSWWRERREPLGM